MLTRKILLGVSLLLCALQAHALVLYDGVDDVNDPNRSDPGTGAPYYAVAQVCDNGGSYVRGSAVYIRGKYMLTADHVSLRSHITFDGVTYWARDTNFSPVSIGTADIKLIKLIEDPGLTDVTLHTSTSGDDISYTSGNGRNQITVDVIGTLIAYGRGRNLSVADSASGADNTWAWGSNATPNLAKRWGTNEIEGTTTLSGITGYNYDYSALRIHLDSDSGNDEAGLAVYDSGSGIFVQNNGNWTLAGISTLVQTQNTSTFSASGDANYYVRIQNHASSIEAAIPDTETYSGWQTDNSLYGADADDTADTDNDGANQLQEFAFAGDPWSNESDILPTSTTVEDGGQTYLEISYTRPTFSNGLTYTVKTTTDLNTWPVDSTGINSPVVVNNGDGTQTETYRRTLKVADADKAFMRVEVSETP
jgi:hypothetical protein